MGLGVNKLRFLILKQVRHSKVFYVHRIFQNIVVKNIFSTYDFDKSIKYYILELETPGICFFNIVRKENVMKLRMKIFVLAAIACFAFGIAGCGEKETAQNVGEKVGKKINTTIESAKDAMHDAESANDATHDAAKDAIHGATK
jgi:hypothetical protein